ncbi:MAG: heavy-metal-associated domain-containing protein [Stenotrophomonas indicatrix]|uniref:heavy-metal-associated domain-containing protein n=1 Tax=Stenotrophomonas indicatrix TaxID=2045451 RepID=UPI000FA3296B|nr:heavy-metal-associated domain-containing protein [Stenotrophomonas indicatrix]
MEFHVEGMTCGGCARSVTKAIELVDPAATVSTDPPSRRVQVQTSASEAQIIAALTEAGFPPRPV